MNNNKKMYLCALLGNLNTLLSIMTLTWRALYIILSTCLSLEKKDRVWLAAQAHADALNRQDPNNSPVGATAIPREEPD